MLHGSVLVYGQSHTEGPGGGDAESTVRGDDSDSNEQRRLCTLSLPPLPTPLFSGRPIARRVPGPSLIPVFPHGKISDVKRSTFLPYKT